jgi:hypothetical protein
MLRSISAKIKEGAGSSNDPKANTYKNFRNAFCVL